MSPAECAAAVAATGKIDYSRSGITSAADPGSGTVLTATVSPQVVEVAQLRKQIAACTTITITISSPDIGEATGTLTEVDVPADDVIGTDSTVTFSASGQSGSITTTTTTDPLRTQVEKVLNG